MKVKKKGTIRAKIKRGDQVVFISGREYNRFDSSGKRKPLRGKVLQVDVQNSKVKVENAMIMKKHRKAVPQMNVQGGIFEEEAWVNISNVAHIDPETGKPSRIKYETRDGEKVRVAKSGEVIPEPDRARRVAKEDNTENAETVEDTVE